MKMIFCWYCSEKLFAKLQFRPGRFGYEPITFYYVKCYLCNKDNVSF